MTCIVGIKTENKVTIAGDSLGSSSWACNDFDNKKIFHLGDRENVIAGYTTSFRAGQIIECFGEDLIDELSEMKGEIDYKYMTGEFVKNLRELFEEHGYDKSEGCQLIIAVNADLYTIQEDYSVLKPSDGYFSVGSGADNAFGSLNATKDLDIPEDEKLLRALKAAEAHTPSVRSPFYITDTTTNEIKKLK